MTFLVRTPWDTDPASIVTPAPPDVAKSVPKPRGRRPAAASMSKNAAPAWLWHHLTISGPTADVTTFAEAARGPGVIPWHVDYAQVEEDIFHRAVASRGGPNGLSIEGCHILARQFRQRIEAREEKAAALIGQSRACPFDLRVLLPIPAEILQRGPAIRSRWTGWRGTGDERRVSSQDCRASEPIGQPAAAWRPRRDLLWVLHRGGHAARGGGSTRRALAHVTVCADATSGGLTAPVMEAAATTATTDEGEEEGPTAGRLQP